MTTCCATYFQLAEKVASPPTPYGRHSIARSISCQVSTDGDKGAIQLGRDEGRDRGRTAAHSGAICDG
jgi:hypothetical protein